MEARILDAEGPRAGGVARVLAAMVVSTAYAMWMWPPGRFFGKLAIAAAWSIPVAGLARYDQHQLRGARLELGPGWVDVRDAGLFNAQRIRATDVIGASTAAVPRGVLLAIAREGRRSPTLIEVATEEEAANVRRALGVGHGGFGKVAWQTAWSPVSVLGLFARFAWLASPFVIMASERGSAVRIVVALSMLVTLLLAVLDWFSFLAVGTPPITMDASSVTLFTDEGWRTVRYGDLLDVRVLGNRVVLTTAEGSFDVKRSRESIRGEGLSPDAAWGLEAQLRSAAGRARGYGKDKDDRAGQLEALRPREGEPAREWLVRLDGLGRSVAAGAGYRATPFLAEDLLAVLDDPEADALLRAGAARVLRSSSVTDAKVRVDAAVASARDEEHADALRHAAEDEIEEAAAYFGRRT